MLHVIDIYNGDKGLSLAAVKGDIDAVIIKATEGSAASGHVQGTCDSWFTDALNLDIPRGIYHVMTSATGTAQAEYFVNNCRGYFGKCIPILDVEGISDYYPCDAGRAYDFCKRVIDLTGVKPMVYMNRACLDSDSWERVRDLDCDLWIANYPWSRMTWAQAEANLAYMCSPSPWSYAAMWQFSGDGRVDGWKGDIDKSLFFGTREQWEAYYGDYQASANELDSNPWYVAREVINNLYGTGDERRSALGARYEEIQKCVNILLEGDKYKLAEYVIAGDLDNGERRRFILGNRYSEVQMTVNKMV